MKQLSERGFDEVAKRFKLLGDASRLKILDFLRRNGEQTVGTIAVVTGYSQAQASRQLSQLREAGFLARRQNGNTVFYLVDDPSVFNLCEIVCGRLESQAASGISGLYATRKSSGRKVQP